MTRSVSVGFLRLLILLLVLCSTFAVAITRTRANFPAMDGRQQFGELLRLERHLVRPKSFGMNEHLECHLRAGHPQFSHVLRYVVLYRDNENDEFAFGTHDSQGRRSALALMDGIEPVPLWERNIRHIEKPEEFSDIARNPFGYFQRKP